MTLFKVIIWILILKYHPSKGFPPDALTGSAYYTKHHADITDFAIRIAVGRFITENNLTVIDDDTDVINIVSNFFGDDSDGYEKFVEKQKEIVENVQNQEKSKEAHIHCNSEQIELAHNHVIKLRGQIKELAQSAEPNISLIREMIGKCIYTIQAFYSGTNWVEMNGDEVYNDFGVPNKTLMAIAGATVDTCQDCDNSGTKVNSCKNNLLVNDMLTSGYQTGQDVQPPYKTSGDIGKGKCGFGGSDDTENGDRTAKGGINKDRLDPKYSPHHHLHYKAFYAARKATELFLRDEDIGIINELNVDTFAQIFGLVKRYQASFGFVIDDTGSMGPIIAQVRKACIDFVTNVLGTPNAPSNYILVTYNDPERHRLRLMTENGVDMISALDNVTVNGGGDCPEYAMSGLQKGIEMSKEKSTIFFFTDAPAKDALENQTVIDAVNEKNIDLKLFLQDYMCSRRRKRESGGRKKRDVGSDAYSLVAEGTGGTVYRFNTAQLGDIIRQISEEIFPSATAIVDMFKLYPEDGDLVLFPVDNMLNNVKITVTGAYSEDDVDIKSPFGSIMKAENTSVLFESPDKVVVTVLNPTDGIYKVNRTGNNNWSVNITAQTSVDFHYAITVEADDGNLYKVLGNPIIGERYTLFFTVYNLPVGINASSLRLKTSNSTTNYLNLVQVTGDFDSTFFVSTTLTSDQYEVSLYGTDSSGNTWMRTSPYFISPATIRLTLNSITDLYKNTVGNVSYTVENKGSENETFVVDVTDNRALLTGQTSFTPLISSNGSTGIIFQINGSSLYNTVTYNITVRKQGSVNILVHDSQTIYISPDIAPTCTVEKLVGKCDALDATSCSGVTWNGQATITYITELSSISGSTGWNFEISSVHSSPINISASGDCCTPSAYLTVTDKNSNFARCHFYLGNVLPIENSKQLLSRSEQIAIGVVGGIIGGCLFATLVTGILIYRKAIKPKLGASKINTVKSNSYPHQEKCDSKEQFNNVTADLN
ncbi:von Willebrand factor A domain-containing protein 7-like [Mytilus californianus]|uniref:von Willebrand factor A domain-containing protein 7-like n=1 Tax=Mytilus californianus TaxID=6549 RepID=UPI0022480430|nr:von Willebrand factor A domain-containing protein 7-like [Mytilus californianus]